MKLKNTLILLLIAGAIFAFIYLYEAKMPTTREAQERAGRVVQFDRDKIDGITIKNTETQIELRKQKDGTWLMEKPLKDRADSMAINQLFTTAEALKSDETIPVEKGGKKDQLKEFGLSKFGDSADLQWWGEACGVGLRKSMRQWKVRCMSGWKEGMLRM